MFSPTLPLSLLAALPFISAVPSNSTYNHVINPSPALTPAALNISIPASKKPIPNISIPSNDITVQCLPARYGSKIPIADCIDAVGQIVPDPEIHDWADRHGGYAKRHFPLPFMLMGRGCPFPRFLRIGPCLCVQIHVQTPSFGLHTVETDA